jgi:hypothetical protein
MAMRAGIATLMALSARDRGGQKLHLDADCIPYRHDFGWIEPGCCFRKKARYAGSVEDSSGDGIRLWVATSANDTVELGRETRSSWRWLECR